MHGGAGGRVDYVGRAYSCRSTICGVCICSIGWGARRGRRACGLCRPGVFVSVYDLRRVYEFDWAGCTAGPAGVWIM